MTFSVPMKWRELKNHVNDCYFCCDSVSDILAIYKLRLVYPNLNSVMRQIPHYDILPFSGPPENGLALLEQMESEDGSSLQAIQHSAESHRRGL
jgi:hypothetical protein